MRDGKEADNCSLNLDALQTSQSIVSLVVLLDGRMGCVGDGGLKRGVPNLWMVAPLGGRDRVCNRAAEMIGKSASAMHRHPHLCEKRVRVCAPVK